MEIKDYIRTMGEQALEASRKLALLSAGKKNRILLAMADAMEAEKEFIKHENEKDMAAGREAGLSKAMLDRLLLSDERIAAIAGGLREIADLKDPVGKTIKTLTRPNGLKIKKIRVPMGVIAIIYESRPNVTADAAALCFKTSNAVILRGGKEAAYSNKAIADTLQAGGRKKGLPENAIQLVDIPGHESVKELVRLEGLVNLVIPRGGERLIRMVTENARVPVIKHYKGVCHTYIDESADVEMAVKIAENAKCQRPGVCNAMETLLVHQEIAPTMLPAVVAKLRDRGVEIRGDEQTARITPEVLPATEEDWATEYLDMILSIRVVANVQEAIDHINKYGSGHSDAIVATAPKAIKAFLTQVDASTVYVNASTRFTDGAEFGMGAEIGISTDKLHARGPMGLEELCTYKYQIYGSGQIRE